MHGTFIVFFKGTLKNTAHINYIFFKPAFFFYLTIVNIVLRLRRRNVMRVMEINRCQHVGYDAVVCFVVLYQKYNFM